MIRKLYPLLATTFGVLTVASLVMWQVAGPSAGLLGWEVKHRKTVMAVAYKAHGNPAAMSGRYYVGKLILTNKGQQPVRDVRVSYQVPDYISWTTPDVIPELLPGQTVIPMWYPKFPAKVAELTSSTPCAIETKISWTEGGKQKEQIVKNDLLLRSVNEMEYTTLPASEITGYADAFENSELLASFVTSDDPVVKTYVAEISKRAGGTTAGLGGGVQETTRFMNAVYDFMMATGMQFTSGKGVPEKVGDIQSIVQTIRLPRDVIRTNNGLCVELAILWSAILEQVGIRSHIALYPGHALVIGMDGATGMRIPVECNAIGGGNAQFPVFEEGRQIGMAPQLTFQQSVQLAQAEIQQAQQQGWLAFLDTGELHTKGLRPPELPKPDFNVDELVAKRAQAGLGGAGRGRGVGRAAEEPAVGRGAAANLADFIPWEHPEGLITLAYPKTWTTDWNRVQTISQVAPWFLFYAGDDQAGTTVEVLHWREGTPEGALQEYLNLLAMIKVRCENVQKQPVTVGTHKGFRCIGDSIDPKGNRTRWNGYFIEIDGGVVAAGAACNLRTLGQQKATIDQVIASIRFK